MRFLRLIAAAAPLAAGAAAMDTPQPGSIYREYRIANRGDTWRVTDPAARHEGSKQYLPNPKLKLEITDLQGAARAEAVIARWGGHPGTSKKRLRVNGRPWIDIPEIATVTGPLRPECVMYQDNPVVPVPLEDLREGENIFEGTCSDQICYGFGWGQWGWDAVIVRVYYSDAKPHPTGRITGPTRGATIEDNPKLAAVAEGAAGIARVDFLAYYEGHDEDGDGVFRDWHHAYQFNRRSPDGGQYPEISGHAGTARAAPFEVEWNTRWVADQTGIQIVARIQDKAGVWFVTEPVRDLALSRTKYAVRFYKPSGVPERYWVRAKRSASSVVAIPETEPLDRAIQAVVHLRTWNGESENFSVNGSAAPIGGGNHVFADTSPGVAVDALNKGENKMDFRSETAHHGVEVCWPGPSLTVRYVK